MHTYLTYLLNPWSRFLLEKLTGSQLGKNFPTFYGTWKVITAFTIADHLSLSCGSVQVWGTTVWFITLYFLWWGLISTSPNPQAGGPPLVSCTRLLIPYNRSYTPYLWPVLHPQSEYKPCRGDRDPVILAILHNVMDLL